MSLGDVAKAYRQLARKYHPDKYKAADAEEKFQAVATAYEILRDEEQRKDYDFMLDNPDEVYRHYYRYYRRRVAPKVDVRIVIAVSITVISVIQYLSWWSRYNSAIQYLVTEPKYRIRAQSIAKQQGLLNDNMKSKGRRNKEAIREREEAILKKVVEENADIRGGYRKPKVTDVLWIQLILLPVTIVQYIYWYVRWLWKFTLWREPYGLQEKHYIIRKFLRISQLQYEAIESHEKELFLDRQLWIPENFKVYKKEKEEQMKAELAENSRYKSYRRYMKSHGPGRMTFDD
ncbi:dnaJ homolog subfamily C member 25-like [Diadema antillarum]|uniref:dnaJ homolog subfamily C member 25-like n=1 Tax=Diadema antillarum TaxID=105358 RepID=UPI003A869620